MIVKEFKKLLDENNVLYLHINYNIELLQNSEEYFETITIRIPKYFIGKDKIIKDIAEILNIRISEPITDFSMGENYVDIIFHILS